MLRIQFHPPQNERTGLGDWPGAKHGPKNGSYRAFCFDFEMNDSDTGVDDGDNRDGPSI